MVIIELKNILFLLSSISINEICKPGDGIITNRESVGRINRNP